MTTASKEVKKLREIAENSLNKTSELHEILDQIEITLSKASIQKFIHKTTKYKKNFLAKYK